MGQQIEFALRQSMHRVLVVLVSFLPGLLAFLVAVVVFALVGVALAAIVRRLLTAARFDERLTAGGTSNSPAKLLEWTSSQSPTRIASRALFWLCALVGIAVGISAFDASYEANARVSLFLLPYFTHLIGAILILFIGTVLARFLARSVLIGAVNAQMQYARFLGLGVKWMVLVLTAAMALDHLRIGGAIVSLAFGILFGGIVLTLSLAIGLGSRDLVSRSIERTMEKPTGPAEVAAQRTAEPASRSRLRHF
ncbi:MAG TPA: hypothetical protein VM865_00355 [Acidobacteriaceae bacterium]|jgi:hypothetical protein|nr:hypothetical protein [Acidobacteriaceae bacterium]